MTTAQPPGSGIMFNFRPDWDFPGLHNFSPPEEAVPGLHNFRPPEEVVPGFRMNTDILIRQSPASTGHSVPNVGDGRFGDSYDAASDTLPASGERPSVCPLVGRVGPNCVY